MVEQNFLHKTAGRHRLAGLAGTPEHIHRLQAQGIGPGLALRVGQRLPRGQAKQLALGGRPLAGRLGRDRQANFIAARQNHRLHGAAQQLRQRQNDDLRFIGVRRIELPRLQRLIDPAREARQRHSRRCFKFRFGAFVQAQGTLHGLAGVVQRQGVPLPGRLQGGAQVAQPVLQRPGAAQGGAQRIDRTGQLLAVGERGQRRALGVGHLAPKAQASFSQLGFGRIHRSRGKRRCVF